MHNDTSPIQPSQSSTAHHIVQRNEKGMLPNLTSLNGIRFIAAIGVFFFHSSLGAIMAPFASPRVSDLYSFIFSISGWVSVSLFFILSGFVMGWSSRPVDHPLRFYRRRLAKIYPMNVVVMVIALVCGVVSIHRPDIWGPNFLLVQAWIPRVENYIGGNTPSWFLGAIVLFYFLFPIVFRWVKALPADKLWTTVFLCYAGMIVSQFVIYYFTHNEPLLSGWPFPIGETQFWLSYTLPITRIFEFVIGLVLSRIILEGYFIRISTGVSFSLVVIGYIIDLYVPFQFSFTLVMLLPLVLLLGSLSVGDINGKTSFLNWPVMQWLGDISFGFYMIHFTLLMLLKRWTGGEKFTTPTALLLLLLAIIASVFCGWLLHKYVEIPCGNYLNSRSRAGKPLARRESVR